MSVCRTQLIDAAIQVRCLRQQLFVQRRQLRNASTSVSPPASGAAKLSNRRLVSLHGVDTPKFLQGILTNNVGDSLPQSGFYAAFLNAQGKVLNDVFVFPTSGTDWQKEQFWGSDDGEPGVLIEVDAGSSEQLLRHIKRHKLRSRFRLRLLDEGELDIWSVWKDDRWTHHTKAKSGRSLSLIDSRAPGMGQRLLLRDGESLTEAAEMDEVAEAPFSTYALRRYLRGIPEGQQEIPREESLPMNYNMDIMGGIDFRKGCYIGQELTIRTHHTGVVRRRVLPVQLYDQATEPPEELVFDPASSTLDNIQGEIRRDDAKKRSTGKLIANIGNVGIGMCRLEQMSDLSITGERNNHSTSDKFVVDNGARDLVGVKAFVPDWIRNRIRDPKLQRRVE